ncbi:expressed unknown protein [Seminavis robusta]|uniref:Peptidase M11 gametolysin domain-containing protein n=1 Tax=Seminavis robusta TaxID=568900 RepID=A0A9N8F4I6_9STRA|nr:expressed unknown protein [Seminavis robusta]|eukprot:Sro2902_g339840.1 n/a (705) ;mRNA; r:3823-6031
MSFLSRTSVLLSVASLALVVVFCVVLVQWSGGVTKKSSASHNLKGFAFASDDTYGLSRYASSKKAMSVCLVSMLEIETKESDDTDVDENDEDHEEMMLCNRVSANYESGVSDESFFYIKNLKRRTIQANQQAMLNNEWFIEYSQDWIKHRQHQRVSTIHIPAHQEVNTIEPAQVPHHHSIQPHHRRDLSEKLEERRQRRMQVTLGPRTVVVVAVSYFLDMDVLYDHVFGANDSLVTQMDACSQGQVTIHPHPDHPIVEVFPPQDVSEYTFVELYSAILDSVKLQLGLRNNQEITSTTDHLLLIVPDAIDRRPGELGWGATPGYFSGIIHSLAPSTMTMLHEIGHNNGLGHAYENNVAYSDMTTVMGYSHRNVVKMCYNGQNMWDMGWFQDRRTWVNLSNNRNDKRIYDLAFYGDYARTVGRDQPVILRYSSLFLTYNRQEAMNIETKEYANMLLVVQELPGQYHSHTNLEAALDVDSPPYEFSFSNGIGSNNGDGNDKVYISVCSHIAGTTTTPDMLTVAIGRNKNNLCDVSTSRQQSNRGVEAAAEPEQLKPPTESLQCETMWPWVEIPDDNSAIGKNLVLCEFVAKDPESYCEKLDSRAGDQVWKTCRLDCPQQSGCVAGKPPVDDSSTPATQNDPASCEDVFSWVEVDMGDRNYVSKTCDDLGVGFIEDRDFFCNKEDTLTHLPVYDICRIHCPNSDCNKI